MQKGGLGFEGTVGWIREIGCANCGVRAGEFAPAEKRCFFSVMVTLGKGSRCDN